MDAYIDELRLFGFDFASPGWALADGSPLPLNEYEGLAALLGSRFGGDGTTTFALPDLRGQAAINQGQGAAPAVNFYIATQSVFPSRQT
jgi:microcystin-dependent protein